MRIIEKLRNIFHKLKFSNGAYTPLKNKIPLKLGSYYLYLKKYVCPDIIPGNRSPLVYGRVDHLIKKKYLQY